MVENVLRRDEAAERVVLVDNGKLFKALAVQNDLSLLVMQLKIKQERNIEIANLNGDLRGAHNDVFTRGHELLHLGALGHEARVASRDNP